MVTPTVHSLTENPPVTNEAAERAEVIKKFEEASAQVRVLAASIAAMASKGVTTKEERATLFNLAKDGKSVEKVIENVRNACLAPHRWWTDFINGIAKDDLQKPLKEAMDSAKEAMKVFDDELERQQKAERQRLENERLERERLQREELDRIAQEAIDKAAAARMEADKERATIDAMKPGPEKATAIRAWREKHDAEALRIDEEGRNKLATAEILGRAEQGDLASAELALDSEVGRGITKRWTFEVEDLDALYKARPDLVKIEPRTREINAEVAASVREIPGIRIYQESSVALR